MALARLRRFLARPVVRRMCLLVAGGIVAMQGGSKILLWYWPYNRDGMANEALLLIAGCLVFVATRLWLGRAIGTGAFSALVGAIAYMSASASGLALSGGPPEFGRFDHYLFSSNRCEFVARFKRPPERESVALPLPTGETTVSDQAIEVDIDSLTVYQARCFYLTPSFGARQSASAETWLRPYLTRWADESGMKLESLRFETRGALLVAMLSADMAGSVLPPRGNGPPSRTHIESWTYVGRRSLLTVTTSQSSGATASTQARAFLEGVRRKSP